MGVTEGKGSQPEGPHPADCRHTCPSPSAETGPCLELTHSWLLSKQLWGQKRWGSPCPWVTPVTVGRAHLGGRWLTVRAPARGEAPSPQWQGCEEQVGHLLTAPGSQVPHAIPVSSRPRALGRGGPWAEGPGPLPSLPAAADPTEVLWALGVGVPEVGGEAWRQACLLGEGHTCWRGRGRTCWSAASPLDFTLLFLPVSPPTSLPGPLLPSLVLLRDGHGCQSTFGVLRPGHKLCRAGLLGALGEYMGRQGLLMTSLTQEPRWPHGRGQASWAAWPREPGANHGGQCPACTPASSGTVRGTQRPVREEGPLRAGHSPELPRLPGKCWERGMTAPAGPRRTSTPAAA